MIVPQYFGWTLYDQSNSWRQASRRPLIEYNEQHYGWLKKFDGLKPTRVQGKSKGTTSQDRDTEESSSEVRWRRGSERMMWII